MEWISTNEKLPDNGERVLLYTPFAIFGEDHSCIGDRESITTCKTRQYGGMVPIFTHWMPLPELPDHSGQGGDCPTEKIFQTFV